MTPVKPIEVLHVVQPIKTKENEDEGNNTEAAKALKLTFQRTQYGHIFCIAHAVGVSPA